MDLGPADGRLTLHTTRAGAAAKVGHDLTIGVARWSIEVDPATRLSLDAELGSLQILKGEGGLKPLSDKDKATILSNARDTLKAKDHPTVTVVIDGPTGTSGTVTGSVTIAGRTRALPLSVTVSDADPALVQVSGTVRQTDFGIKPYSGLLGTLKVADDVTIRLELTVPRP